jgi:exodeoxyribonuclease III
MKIANFNVDGTNGRLAVLLRWLAQAKPDVICLWELKTVQETVSESAIRQAGYGAVWAGQKRWNGVALLARDTDPVEIRRGLPGDPDDLQSRCIEAAVGGILIGFLYEPNGNPALGPKLDHKPRWFHRLNEHTAHILALRVPLSWPATST